MRQMLPAITSVGLPPEKHADRIVAEMLRRIVARRNECWPKLHSIFKLRTKDGTPAAQQRIYDKMCAAVDDFLLGGSLTTGKRGRYEIRLLVLDGWDAERNDIITKDDPIPTKPWIALSVIRLISKGDFRYDTECGTSLLITHHALSRLAQRCGARSIREVYGAVMDIAYEFIRYRVDNKQRMIRDGERMRVKLDDGLGTAVCALVQHSHKDCEGGIVLATLWNDGEPAED